MTARPTDSRTVMLRFLENWFEPVRPSQDYRSQDYILLFLTLAAGTWLRFWHLDNVGLHGDEDIMALAARGIVAHGVPVLPSEMLYFRAPLHTYLLAGSTLLFGDTEWALRMPSAAVGSLCVLLAFAMGKRFLEPKPNLVFVASVAFLPAMIEISQTARMYVFFIATLLVFGILLFRWERRGTTTSFLAAFLVLLVAIQFHRLAVFGAFLMLYPGLANRSWKQVIQGLIALGAAVIASELIGRIANLDYPDASERLVIETESRISAFQQIYQGNELFITCLAIAIAIGVFAIAFIGFDRRKGTFAVAASLATGAVCSALLHYHVGTVALLLGVIGWVRGRTGHNRRLIIVGALVGLIAMVQAQMLQATGEFPGRALIGAYVGKPSVWPVLQFLAFSPVASAILIVAIVVGMLRFAQGRTVPIYFLFFGLAVWMPLVAIGLFSWFPAERYTIGPLPYFLMISVCGLTYLARVLGLSAWLAQQPKSAAIATMVIAAAIIDPAATWQVAKNSYAQQPDHKGAAEFLRKLGIGPMDVIIAEDSIVQTYYLGEVHYRLQNLVGAKSHSRLHQGALYDQYSGAEVLGSGEEFEAVLERNSGRNVYVISSAQVSENLMRRNRGNGISKVLESGRMEVIHVGRDNETIVWKARR